MEPSTQKESIVARLFGFGRKRAQPEEHVHPKDEPIFERRVDGPGPSGEGDGRNGGAGNGSGGTPPAEEETGFARTDDSPARGSAADGARVHMPEQVIRIRSGAARRRDEVIHAIGDSFRELSSLLGSVSERLDRQDDRSANLAEQLQELPEYLRTLPKLQHEHNEALRDVAGQLARLPEAQEAQARALQTLGERVAEGTEAVHGVADTLARIPEVMRERAEAHEQLLREQEERRRAGDDERERARREEAEQQKQALEKMVNVQTQTAKVVHIGAQKQLQLFQQATQKTLQSVQQSSMQQQKQLERMMQASESSMKRMFILAVVFMTVAVGAAAALFLMR